MCEVQDIPNAVEAGASHIAVTYLFAEDDSGVKDNETPVVPIG